MHWFEALSRRDRWLVIGLLVLTVSQFLTWGRESGGSIAMAGIGRGAPVFSSIAGVEGLSVSGWTIHPLALLILPVLLGVFATRAKESSLWRRWGTWTALALMVDVARFDAPLGDGCWGVAVGWAGVGIALLGIYRTREAHAAARGPQ